MVSCSIIIELLISISHQTKRKPFVFTSEVLVHSLIDKYLPSGRLEWRLIDWQRQWANACLTNKKWRRPPLATLTFCLTSDPEERKRGSNVGMRCDFVCEINQCMELPALSEAVMFQKRGNFTTSYLVWFACVQTFKVFLLISSINSYFRKLFITS